MNLIKKRDAKDHPSIHSSSEEAGAKRAVGDHAKLRRHRRNRTGFVEDFFAKHLSMVFLSFRSHCR
jgi:hypothetical protein